MAEYGAYPAAGASVTLLDDMSETLLTFHSNEEEPAHIVLPTNKVMGLITGLLSAAEDAESTVLNGATMPHLRARACNVVRLPEDPSGLFLIFRVGFLSLQFHLGRGVAERLAVSLTEHLTDEGPEGFPYGKPLT